MNHDTYSCLRIDRSDGVATVTIDHAPINLLDLDLLLELDRLSRELETDADVSVVVVQSADPEFFIAHADVTLIERMPSDDLDRPTELPLLPPSGGVAPADAAAASRKAASSSFISRLRACSAAT